MANVINISAEPEKLGDFRKLLRKVFQSGNINFLLGSGASVPAIPLAGNIEQEINDLYDAGNIEGADRKKYDFLIATQSAMNDLINGAANANNSTVLQSYQAFLRVLEGILIGRKTNILPRQANVFTTNYDLFVEKASEAFPVLKVNDGFNRTPSIAGKSLFAPQNYFNSVFNNGNLYNYKVEIPCINLVKLHGSFSWKKDGGDVVHSILPKPAPVPAKGQADVSADQITAYNQQNALILPHKGKFQETLMDRIYYDLLRIYSNELDKENTLLMAFGFSFADEHIFDITKRALKNPTLKLIIFCFSRDKVAEYEGKFSGYNNVSYVVPEEGENLDFNALNALLGSVLDTSEAA